GEDLVLSDIQLAAVIRKATGQSSFDKNGLNVLPNPSNVFSITLPMLYYYAEVYNLGPAGDGADYLVESWISDADGNVVRTFPAKKAAKSGRTGGAVGGNNIITLPSAIYKFNLQVVDGERRARQSCTFQLFKPDKNAEIAEAANAAREGANLLRGYYMTLSDEQFEEELEQVLSVARREEKEVAAALANRSEKTTFLVDFWQRHDPDPATANNEYRQQFQELVQLANVTFENRFRPGWKTERGRVLLTYGRPDEIVKTPVQRQGKPYETWTYNNLENGSIFIFADLRGFGQYELIHSTYSQELNNPNWENTLKEVRLNSGENDDVFR
ncbi:MAG TPA: GWxTD domain-containing protein, partial [Calditrichia bacterium]|nr:GWxTD domain-containing protein [Calditrichia bacterium]